MLFLKYWRQLKDFNLNTNTNYQWNCFVKWKEKQNEIGKKINELLNEMKENDKRKIKKNHDG